MAQWVKGPVLSLLWRGFDSWPGNFICHRRAHPKKTPKMKARPKGLDASTSSFLTTPSPPPPPQSLLSSPFFELKWVLTTGGIESSYLFHYVKEDEYGLEELQMHFHHLLVIWWPWAGYGILFAGVGGAGSQAFGMRKFPGQGSTPGTALTMPDP